MIFDYDEDDEEGGDIQIDPNDLEIIRDKLNWKPSKEHILAYAKLLGFDKENDPPELLKIAEKYLTVELPEEYCRAFIKVNLRILYINTLTNDVEESTKIEELALEEFQEAKEKIKNEENKIKVIPRKKIAPIGSKKITRDIKIEKEKESLKKIQKINEDKKEKIDKKIKYDEDEDEDFDFDYSEKRNENNSNQNKINNKKIIDKTSENNVLNLKDSEHIIQYFDNPSSEDEDDKSIKPIPSKKNINFKKEKSAENIKSSKEFDDPPNIEENKYKSINPKYQRSNKKRQNLRYERRSLDVLRANDLNLLKEQNNVESSNEENNNNKNKKNKSINLNISKESLNSTELKIQKNNYKENIKTNFNNFKTNLKNKYIQNKTDFIEDYINDLNNKNSHKIKELKEDNKEIISSYEIELKNKMNKYLEEYKNKLINEYNQNSDDSEDYDEGKENTIKNLELKYKKLKSEINIQTEKNNMKKELFEQKKKNEINEKLKILDKNQKSQISILDKNSKDKLDKISNELKSNFILYQKQYELKNSNNYIPKGNDDLIKEECIQYEKESRAELDTRMKELKDEYDNKLIQDIEEFKENIIKSNDKEKIAKENKDIEKEYFNVISELKKENKYQIKNIEDTIKNLFEKASNSFDKIKNKSVNDINILISDISKNIKEINKNGNNEDKSSSLINEFLSELISKKLLILNKFNSYVEISEEELKQNIILIEYFIEIIRIINEIISDNNQKSINLGLKNENLNEFLINEILKKINDLMEEYKYKYEEEQNNKFYPLLHDSLQKLMNLKFENENNYKIPFSSSRYNRIINSNQNMSNINYLNNINNSVLNDSNYNNNYNNFNSNRTNNNINPRLDELEKTSININNILNNNNFNSPRKAQMNNSSYYNPPTQRNNFPSNLYNTMNPSSFRTNNNIFPIKEDIESNLSSMNINNINIPQLPNELLNNLSSENIRNYKLIIDFLVREYKQINDEQNIYMNRYNANQKLNILKESGEYMKYNNLFEQISKQENDKNSQYLRDIESKKSILELIKNNCEESFSFILKYNNKNSIINNKLGLLITHIEDYNKHFNSRKFNNSYSFNKNHDLENILNNTFQINKRNYNQESILNNTYSNRFDFEKKRINNNTYNFSKYFN